MALFVPILRLLMLFLNVYDSYKTLKPPPPSTRNPSRPSVRGATQRKRDMKGCLAVWIVWASFALYERVFENFLSLFIPFYDEFKSLVLLFLIMTRARGAEPIYLHLIRPTIKPYTKTLDFVLEVMLVASDFLIALSSYPARLVMQYWRKFFKQPDEDTSTDVSSSESSNEFNPSEVSSSFFASSGQPARHDVVSQDPAGSSENFPKGESRRPSLSQTARHEKRRRTQEDIRPQEIPAGSQIRNPSSSRKDSRDKSMDDATSNTLKPTSSSQYEIWYPPTAKPIKEDAEVGRANRTLRPLAVSVNVTEEISTVVPQQVDEWRQYPAFPSAYPPTPITTTSKLLPTALAASPPRFTSIEEETCTQDFRRSLLPPRGPLNPYHAGDLSDEITTFGIPPFLSRQISSADDADDSMSADDYENEDEDDFNTTLKTPLQPQGSAKSWPQLHLRIPPPCISISTVPSQSSALTTVDNNSPFNSPLRTRTCSESSPSSLPFNPLTSSTIGKKRSYPRPHPPSSRNRVREIEEDSLEQDSDTLSTTMATFTHLEQQSRSKLSIREIGGAADSASDSGGSSSDDQEQIHPEEKRRKVIRSSPSTSIRPLRRLGDRTSMHAPSRTRSRVTVAQVSKNYKGRQQRAAVVPKTRSARVKTGDLGVPHVERDDQSSASISEADKNGPSVPAIGMTLRSRSKK